jgi:hypothetical protein
VFQDQLGHTFAGGEGFLGDGGCGGVTQMGIERRDEAN